MVHVTCTGRIERGLAPYTTYVIKDANGLELKINASALRSAMYRRKVKVDNLKISADGTRIRTTNKAIPRTVIKASRQKTKEECAKLGVVGRYLYDQAVLVYKFLAGSNYIEDIILDERNNDGVLRGRFRINQAIILHDGIWFIEGIAQLSGKMLESSIHLSNGKTRRAHPIMTKRIGSDEFSKFKAGDAFNVVELSKNFLLKLNSIVDYRIMTLPGLVMGELEDQKNIAKVEEAISKITNKKRSREEIFGADLDELLDPLATLEEDDISDDSGDTGDTGDTGDEAINYSFGVENDTDLVGSGK